MERSGYPYRDASLEERRRHPDGSRRQKVRYTRQYDFALLFLTVGIALFGVIMIYSAGYYTAALKNNPLRYVKSQLFGLVLGIVGMIVVSLVDYQVFMQKMFRTKITMAHLLYLLAIILQGVVLFVGAELNGAKRWLKIGPIQFQPSEVSKIAAIVFIAYAVYQRRRDLDRFAGFCRILLYMAPLILLILKENLSSAIIVAGITGLQQLSFWVKASVWKGLKYGWMWKTMPKRFRSDRGFMLLPQEGFLERGWGRACKSWALFRRHTMI